jgi:hypothetical protein
MYDIWKGAEAYCGRGWGSTSSSSIILWLDLWLSDMLGIQKRKSKNERYAVNCSDTATFVEVIGSLGALQNGSLRSYSIGGESESFFGEPTEFGYLQPTYLIGRHQSAIATTYSKPDRCNNPMYGTPGKHPDMLCDKFDERRSWFTRHKIVVETVSTKSSLKPGPSSGSACMVLDACAGPHHIAASGMDTAIDAFLKDSIDRDSKLYSPYMFKSGESRSLGPVTVKHAKPAEDNSKMATRPNIIRKMPGLDEDVK